VDVATTTEPFPLRRDLLNHRARAATSSAIRDLLEHAQRPGMLSLAGGLPDPSRFPAAELADIAADVLRNDGDRVLQYGLTAGERDLRHHIVETTPAATTIHEVVVTTGSQQGLELLAGVLLEPGDPVVVADPEYLGATQAFRRADADLVAFGTDADGIDVDTLEHALHDGLRPKLVYLVPHFHNPSGATLSDMRRARLLELAEQFGFLMVFDDPYRDLHLDGSPPVEIDPHPWAVHLRSVSKVLAPGLRVGWAIGPTWLTEAIERAKQSADLHTSTVSQAIVRRAITADWYPSHLDELRAANRIKRDALCAALQNRLGDRISFVRSAGGMFVWAELPGVSSTDELLRSALDQGVAFVPGSAFAVEQDLSRHLRLSWATASPPELVESVERLARSIENQ
jgi:2-aminoadipate transaminase